MRLPLRRQSRLALLIGLAVVASACGSAASSATRSLGPSAAPNESVVPVASASAPSGATSAESVRRGVVRGHRAPGREPARSPGHDYGRARPAGHDGTWRQADSDQLRGDQPPGARGREPAVHPSGTAASGVVSGAAGARPRGRTGDGLLRPQVEGSIRSLGLGRSRAGGEDHLLARVHPCPPGPELRARQAGHRHSRPGRPRPGQDGSARGRRDSVDDAVGSEEPLADRPAGGCQRFVERGAGGPAGEGAGDPAPDAAVPVRAGPLVRPGYLRQGRLGRGRRDLRQPAGLDLADPPLRLVHVRSQARDRDDSGRARIARPVDGS